jgi:hypothetical protein
MSNQQEGKMAVERDALRFVELAMRCGIAEVEHAGRTLMAWYQGAEFPEPACDRPSHADAQIKAWQDLMAQIGLAVDCLFSTFPDANEHILKKIRALAGDRSSHAAPAGWKNALHGAVSALYFNDSSDYESALWGVVESLMPGFIEELQRDPMTVYGKTKEMVSSDHPSDAGKQKDICDRCTTAYECMSKCLCVRTGNSMVPLLTGDGSSEDKA